MTQKLQLLVESYITAVESISVSHRRGMNPCWFYPQEGVPTGDVLASLWHVSGWRSMNCPHVLPGTSSEHYLCITCFRGRTVDTISIHFQQAVNGRLGMVSSLQSTNAVIHFTAPRSRAQRPAAVRIGSTLLPEESMKSLRLWWDSHLSLKKHISVLKKQCMEALNHILVVANLNWGRYRDTLLMLYRYIVRSKLDCGCIVYGTESNTDLQQLDSIHNFGLRLALGAFCTSPVSSLYTEVNEAPLEERRVKLSIHNCLKTRACNDNPAHHSLHEFDRTTRDLYAPRPNGRGGMTRPQASPSRWSQSRGSYDLCRDRCRIVLPPVDTQLSTRNSRLWSLETRPHWRSKQMYDLQTRDPG